MGSLFPHLPEGAVLARDEDLFVLDKPAGVASQSSDPELPDDLPTRLRRFLGNEEQYLGVHQRLDRETSGVTLFTARKEANAEVAKLFEGRAIVKTYVAGVVAQRPPRAMRLVHALAEGDDGKMVALPKERGGRGSVTAISDLEPIEWKKGRALVRVRLETGRKHQIRAQLEAVGLPVAGDPLYSATDVGAPRLLLHAAELSFSFRGKQRSFLAKPPYEFTSWLERGGLFDDIYEDARLLQAALVRARDRRYGLAHSSGERKTTAFRIVNEAGDGLPGLAVDAYGDYLVAHFYEGETWEKVGRRERVLDALATLGFRGVYAKYRPKQANVLVDTRRAEIAPKLPVRGEEAPSEFEILEEGVPYTVRLGDGLSTGIFLDQRANRKRVVSTAQGKRTLNLFSYTCPFSVAATVGGALSTVDVDASLSALEWGKKNIARLGKGGEHRFVGDDVFRWIRLAEKKGERFDLIFLDPPSYSSTKKSRWVASSDYGSLVLDVARLLAEGGEILACCNHRKITKRNFRKQIVRALSEGGFHATVRDLPEPLDFPAPIGADCHLKAVWIRIG